MNINKFRLILTLTTLCLLITKTYGNDSIEKFDFNPNIECQDAWINTPAEFMPWLINNFYDFGGFNLIKLQKDDTVFHYIIEATLDSKHKFLEKNNFLPWRLTKMRMLNKKLNGEIHNAREDCFLAFGKNKENLLGLNDENMGRYLLPGKYEFIDNECISFKDLDNDPNNKDKFFAEFGAQMRIRFWAGSKIEESILFLYSDKLNDIEYYLFLDVYKTFAEKK